MNADNRPFLDYVIELRSRLLCCLGVLVGLLIALLPFANSLYHLLAEPLLKQLPQGSSLIATALTAPLFVPLKFTLVLAFVLAIPFILYQTWLFIAPALYKQERRLLWGLLSISILLFYIGMTFAYFIVFPMLINFFLYTTPMGVTVLPDISQYLDLVLQLMLAFGLAFEVPVVIFVLVLMGITNIKAIADKRRYFILFAFIIAMFITPPDVVSQTMLAVPLCFLFELGLLMARFVFPVHKNISDLCTTKFTTVRPEKAGKQPSRN